MRYVAAILVLFAACTTAPRHGPEAAPPPIAARGMSCDSLIPMTTTTEKQGIAAEHQYVNENYPGATWKGQSLSFCAQNQPVDVIHITTANGVDRTLYFDVSGWFGKH